MQIEIIAGSARPDSITRRVALHLLNELSNQFEAKVGLIDIAELQLPPVQSVISTLADAPVGIRATAARMLTANAFVLVSPEYNGSYSPAMKNFLDYFPQQPGRVFGIVTASPGSLGGIRAAMQMQALTFGLMGIGSPQMLVVPEVDQKFDTQGKLVDQRFKPAVDKFIERFLWLSRAIHRARLHSRTLSETER